MGIIHQLEVSWICTLYILALYRQFILMLNPLCSLDQKSVLNTPQLANPGLAYNIFKSNAIDTDHIENKKLIHIIL